MLLPTLLIVNKIACRRSFKNSHSAIFLVTTGFSGTVKKQCFDWAENFL